MRYMAYPLSAFYARSGGVPEWDHSNVYAVCTCICKTGEVLGISYCHPPIDFPDPLNAGYYPVVLKHSLIDFDQFPNLLFYLAYIFLIGFYFCLGNTGDCIGFL